MATQDQVAVVGEADRCEALARLGLGKGAVYQIPNLLTLSEGRVTSADSAASPPRDPVRFR